jgi:hypothetical protein
MFRVLDDRPGSHAAVSLAPPGPLRVYAHVRASADAADLTGPRVLLITDLLARAAEVDGLQVFTTWALSGESAGVAAVERAAVALGVHPPVLAADSATAWPGGPADVHIAGDGAIDDDGSGILIRAAAARLAEDARLVGHAIANALGEDDALAVRLALMSLPRHQSAEFTADTLADARRTLSEWRSCVATWAEFPSGAIPERIATTVRAAFGDLDIVAVLALLSQLVTDESVPPGRRFETFVYVDRVLGLDLPRDIGR